MKKHLVGTAAGRALQQAAQWLELKRLPLHNPEQAPLTANKILAQRLVTQLCPPGGTFVDVGAHLGTVFSAVRHYDTSITLIAFEADPDKAAHLRRKFPWCTLHAVAVGETTGQVRFFIDGDATAYNSLVALGDRTQTAIEVDCVTLDEALAGTAPDVLKIDIEGAELGALRGGAAVIETHRPTLLFESALAGENALGYSPDAIWAWLDARGYGVFYPDRLAHAAPPLPLEVFLDAHLHPRRTVDFFAVHRDKQQTVRDRAHRILNTAG